MENDLLHSAGRRSPLAVQVMSGPLTFLSFPGAAPPSFASSQPLSLHLWLSLSAVLNLCPVILAELHALVVQQEKRTCVFRAAVLQPAGNSFHPVFFFPFGRAMHHVGASSALGAERPPDTPGKALHRGLHQGGPFPSFPDVLVCLWGKQEEPFQLGLYSCRCFQPVASPWQHLAFHGPLTSHP